VPWPFSGPFAPAHEGVVEVIEPKGVHAWRLRVLDLGLLRVPSGKLLACDPFAGMPDGVIADVPKGDYPVKVSIADVSDAQDGSHNREAYLSVVIASGEAASHRPVVPPKEKLLLPDHFYGVNVDAGTVAFVDAEAVRKLMPKGNWYNELFENGRGDSWFAQMDSDSPLPKGYANIVLPLARHGENLILAHSGWGDGFYPVIGVYDSNRRLLSVHVDLQVVGEYTA
jgi:hypothetical protein